MKKFFSLGLIRGLIWQIMGTGIGVGFVTLIRVLIGLPTWKAEPATVFGALLGVIFFLVGIGAFSDWYKMAKGEEVEEMPDESRLGWRRYLGVSLDHKIIGIQYMVLAIILMGVGGIFALIFRTELAETGMQFLTLIEYNTLMSLHGIVMIVSILVGIAAIMNYTVPLLIGASDMAFPRLNAFSFWIAVPSGLVLLSSMFLGGFDTGWTGYPPLSVRAPLGMQMFFLGVALVGFTSILGSINIIATIIRLRTKGMTPFRMRIFIWAAIATSIISLTATQLIGLSFEMVMFQRLFGMGFFDPIKGGNPILFQHLFCFIAPQRDIVFFFLGVGS